MLKARLSTKLWSGPGHCMFVTAIGEEGERVMVGHLLGSWGQSAGSDMVALEQKANIWAETSKHLTHHSITPQVHASVKSLWDFILIFFLIFFCKIVNKNYIEWLCMHILQQPHFALTTVRDPKLFCHDNALRTKQARRRGKTSSECIAKSYDLNPTGHFLDELECRLCVRRPPPTSPPDLTNDVVLRSSVFKKILSTNCWCNCRISLQLHWKHTSY